MADCLQCALQDLDPPINNNSDQVAVILLTSPDNGKGNEALLCDVYAYIKHTTDIGVHAKPIDVSEIMF